MQMNRPFGGNPAQMLQQLMQNPAAILQRAGMNIPSGMTSPADIIQHLMNSGQINQQQFERARQMAQTMKRR